jgi:nucleoid-associated protein EbfC
MFPDEPRHDPDPSSDSDEAYDPAPLGGGMPDLQALLHQASAMQERLVAAQHDLEEARFEGTSGGGLVHATVTGTGELIGLTLDPAVCDPDDPETLGDLVVAAVRNAVDSAQRSAAATMGEVSGGLGGALGADLTATLGLGSGGIADAGPRGGSGAGFVMPLDDEPGNERE